MARVFLGLGTNLGDRKANLAAALDRIGEEARLLAVSSLYDTAPVGDTDQQRFLNLVVEVDTSLTPEEMLALVKRIEVEVGRRPSRRWGPRAIDIDILLYGCAVISLPHLTVPHPRMCERVFVLAPIIELSPDLTIPGSGRLASDFLAELPDQDVHRLLGEDGRLQTCMK